MKLDTGETIELDIKPNEKILVAWFLSKTITYSLATMFFVFVSIFVINTFTFVSELEKEESNKTEVIDSVSKIESSEEKDVKKTESSKNKKPTDEIGSPFSYIFDYWGWALALIGLSAVIIQTYMIFLRKTYRYIITNRRCIFIGGILKRVERTIPYKKITDIQRSQNIIERILGIWNVQIFTPGTASMQVGNAKARAELNFDGLLNSEEVYEAIHKHTQTS